MNMTMSAALAAATAPAKALLFTQRQLTGHGPPLQASSPGHPGAYKMSADPSRSCTVPTHSHTVSQSQSHTRARAHTQ